jgi:transposase-like protein
MKFRKNKKFTEEEKQEIVEYIKVNNISSVKERFGVWPETVKYWIASEDEKRRISEQGKRRHQKVKDNPSIKKRNLQYREQRKREGITSEKWKEWYNGMSEEKKIKHAANVKQHRLDNLEHYKQRSKKKYLKEKEQGLHRKKYNEDPLHKLKCNIREHIRQAVKYSNLIKDHPSIMYLGCSIEEFKAHIERQFRDGMTWDNHSRGEKWIRLSLMFTPEEYGTDEGVQYE